MRVTRGGESKAHGSIIGAIVAAAAIAAGSIAASASSPAVDAAFRKFWDAGDVGEAARAADAVVRSGVTFEEALGRLKAGRNYSAQAKRGTVRLSRRQGGREFFYDLNVPDTYDPGRRYQVRFHLHGGVYGRDTSEPRGNGSIALMGAEQIYVIPYSWRDAPWWGEAQVENLRGVLDQIKRSYNVDENRVALAGVSDGGTGAYYVAMRDTTPYSSFLPLIGYLMVLRNPSIADAGLLFPNNLRNKPFFVVNGGQDQLYPTAVVGPSVDHLKAGGVAVDYHPQPNGGHNTRWWPEVKDLFESFVHDHPRDPHPARLTWEASVTDRGSRAHWLAIDRVASAPTSPALQPDLNQMARPRPPGYAGKQIPPLELFEYDRPHGRVDLVRTGNTVEAATSGVAEFTLLLSPDVFDFAQPVKVVANGRVLFEGRMKKSLATLMRWAARDNDRTMLFGAELSIKVGS